MGRVGPALRGYLDRRTPGYLVFFVTAQCNLRCRMCFHTAVLDRAASRNVLSLPEIERLARGLPALHNVNFSGGEPFLRDDFAAIPPLFYHHSGARLLTVTTNSTKPERVEQVVRAICLACPDAWIRVAQSLDGMGAVHDEIRGLPGLFERVVELNDRLRKLANVHANLGVSVVTVLSSLNHSHAPALLDFVYDRLHFDDYGALLVRGDPADPTARLPDGAPYPRFQQACVRRARERRRIRGTVERFYRALNEVASELVAEVVTHDRYVTPCLAGRRMVVVDDEGKVTPCELLEGMVRAGRIPLPTAELGSLREHGFDMRRLLGTSHARAVVDAIARFRCRCSYDCAMATNVLYTPRWLLAAALRAARG